MPKIKTHKATSKRFIVTGSDKKIIKRKAGQGHFNARENGEAKRAKRTDVVVAKADCRTIRTLAPYK